jgi:PAS domain S-box-containing protein
MPEENTTRSSDADLTAPQHPVLRLVAIVTVSIMTIETLLMFIFDRLSRHLTIWEDFLDGMLLTVLLSPILYLYLFRPMSKYIAELHKAQGLLQRQHDILEDEVRLRTTELVERNEQQAKLMQELQSAEEKYRNLVNRLPSITYILNLEDDGKLVFVSPQIEQLGYAMKEWNETPELRFQRMHPEDRDRVMQAVSHSRDSGETFDCDYRLYSRDNQVRWFHDEATVVCDRINKMRYLQGVMLDITEKKSMEEELAERRKLVDQQVMQRTEQLERRISVLESANANLSRIINERRNGQSQE